MKKKLILCMILAFSFVLTGCTAEYNVEIYNDTIKEKYSFIEKNDSLLNSIYEENLLAVYILCLDKPLLFDLNQKLQLIDFLHYLYLYLLK